MASTTDEQQLTPDENQSQGDGTIVHIVKIFNDGTDVPYTSSLIKKSLFESSLKEVRSALVEQKVLDGRLACRRFCTKGRSEVQDAVNFATYLEMVSGGEDAAKGKEEVKGASIASPPKQQVTVYISAQKSKTGVNSGAIPKIDLSTTDKTPLKDAKFLQAQSQYDAARWAARAGAADTVHPYEMTEEDWGIVIANNALTCGYNIATRTVKTKDKKPDEVHVLGAERSLYPAFEIKARDPAPFELFHKIGVSPPKVQVRIPRLRVTDASRVDVIETSTAFEETMAKSSFSEDSYEASAGGGAFGFTVGASGGYSSSDRNSTVDGKSEVAKRMHIIYKFPRVELLLDGQSLKPTAECLEDWKNVKGDANAEKYFFEKYGRYLPTCVQLGGRLIATQDVDETDGLTSTERKNAMKLSAGVSFGSPYVEISAKTTHEKQAGSSDSTKHATVSTAINWEALGGDTLLANSPPDWCPTVASFHNWRVMHISNSKPQSNMIPLESLLPNSGRAGQSFQIALKATQSADPNAPNDDPNPPRGNPEARSDDKNPMWMAPRFFGLWKELSQSSLRISEEQKVQYVQGVNNYSPFMGLSTDPVPITIPALGETETPKYGTPYQIKIFDSYLTLADEPATTDKSKSLGHMSILCVKRPPAGTQPPDTKWMFVPIDFDGSTNPRTELVQLESKAKLVCKLANGKYATVQAYDRSDHDRNLEISWKMPTNLRFQLVDAKSADKTFFKLQPVENAYGLLRP